MSQFVFKMPDLGEGTVEAEIVAWHTRPGDSVNEDQVIVEVMTDKAAVEVPAPVSGRVVSITGEPGDKVAVGSPLIVFELVASDGLAAAGPSAVDSSAMASGGSGAASPTAVLTDAAVKADAATLRVGQAAKAPGALANGGLEAATPAASGHAAAASVGSGTARQTAATQDAAAKTSETASAVELGRELSGGTEDGAPAQDLRTALPATGRVKASPANRRRAREAGIDLRTITGSGPGGRILSGDLVGEPAVARAGTPPDVSAETSSGRPMVAETTEIKVIGLRRLIAERMSAAKRNIPHFAYVEEVDVTELESLRVHLNGTLPRGAPSLTYLPLVVLALTRALESFPQCNVRYDAAREVLVRHRAVHVGVATQTPDGLKVPVVRNAQALSLWDLAAEIRRVAERARSNKATRDELVGSTITVTSLGKLGGIASTPVINAPEVAIIGLNKAVERPVVHGGAVAVRRIMNLSSSFDHRFVDGYDAAAMIQALKELLEHPATIFIPKVNTP